MRIKSVHLLLAMSVDFSRLFYASLAIFGITTTVPPSFYLCICQQIKNQFSLTSFDEKNGCYMKANMLFIANTTLETVNQSLRDNLDNQTESDGSEFAAKIIVMSWIHRILSDPFVSKWFGWLMTPVVVAFVLPTLILLFIWSSSLVLYVHRFHKRRLMRRLREAYNESDIAKAGREIIASLWDAQVS